MILHPFDCKSALFGAKVVLAPITLDLVATEIILFGVIFIFAPIAASSDSNKMASHGAKVKFAPWILAGGDAFAALLT